MLGPGSSVMNGGPQPRLSSPPGASTLITRAPMIAEHHRRVRAGERAGQVEDGDVIERRHQQTQSTSAEVAPPARAA